MKCPFPQGKLSSPFSNSQKELQPSPTPLALLDAVPNFWAFSRALGLPCRDRTSKTTKGTKGSRSLSVSAQAWEVQGSSSLSPPQGRDSGPHTIFCQEASFSGCFQRHGQRRIGVGEGE